jgi:hypothetical protein
MFSAKVANSGFMVAQDVDSDWMRASICTGVKPAGMTPASCAAAIALTRTSLASITDCRPMPSGRSRRYQVDSRNRCGASAKWSNMRPA